MSPKIQFVITAAIIFVSWIHYVTFKMHFKAHPFIEVYDPQCTDIQESEKYIYFMFKCHLR